MTDRDPSKDSESARQSLVNRETVAPSGLEDSTPTGSGPFSALPVQFGRYRVTKLLGRGAMGTVYLAHDPDLGKDVALKVPKFSGDEDPVLLERFRREARAAGDLNHENICGVYEVGQIGMTHFIAMQYIDGRPLSDYISADVSQRKVATVIRKLALGLAQAHARGIIHRDLKPANIMANSQGEPIIMDFGLARHSALTSDVRATQSGMIVGSPAYMAPEQARGENDKIGPWTDIYGLGTLFFELLTGSLPFRGSMLSVLGQLATQPPPKPSSLRTDVDPKLESLCLKMLEKQPQHRPASMDEVADTLTEWLKAATAKGEPAIALVEEPVALSPTKPATPRADKADGIEAQKQRVTDLLDKREYSAAVELLEKMTNLRDARFEKLVAWAKPKLKEVRATEQKLRDASVPSCDTAQQLLKHYDYVGVIQVLEQVPPAYRSVELRDLLEKVTDLRDECDHLQRDIEEAVRTGDTETLPALVKRLYKLKPNNKAIKQLAADLKQYGAATVIAKRKGQRRFLDPAGRIIEPQHIVWSIVLVVGLFAGVSLMVSNYLKSRKDPVPSPRPSQSTETDSPKTSPPIPSPIRASEPLPQTITSQTTGMKLTLIPAGTFTMGSLASETGHRPNEGSQHAVRISQPFYMGVHEVTQGEYERVMETNPSYFSKGEAGSSKVSGQDTSKFPVEKVSWYDAIEFCNKLSAKDGFPGYYSLTNPQRENRSIKSASVSITGGKGYRLPTEAEWEYACRANTTTPFHFGSVLNGDKANVDGSRPYGTATKGTYLKRSTTVGSYSANAFDLYDMHGNVWEWCEDMYDEKVYANRAGTTIDPLVKIGSDSRVKDGSESRVLRGGSWFLGSGDTRSALRDRYSPNNLANDFGFRVVFSAAAVRTPGDVTGTSPITLPQTVTSQATGMKLTLIPAGTFAMGSPESEEGRSANEGPQHSVKISQPFYLGTYEVTQAEYESVIGTNPSSFSKTVTGRSSVSGQNTSKFPVEMVSWFDAIEFCNKLSAKDGVTPYYSLTNATRDGGSIKSATVEVSGAASAPGLLGYRLPTEAEWEYACRANTATPFHFGTTLNGDQANVNGNFPYGTTTKGKYLEGTTTVGSYGANAFGLFDMHGNVYEWCDDVYDELAYSKRSGSTPDPRVTSGSEYRVLRGGSGLNGSRNSRSALRYRYTPDGRYNNYGFRVVLPSTAVRTRGDVTGTSSITPKNGPAPVVAPNPNNPPPQTITSQSTGMKLTLIPAAMFTMGSPGSEEGRSASEGPQHAVHISQSFYMGMHEVTQGEYEQVMGTNPSYFSNGGAGRSKVSGQDTSQFPVETVAWYDAIEFCSKLSEKDGRTPYYTLTNVTRDSGTIKSATVEVSQAASTARLLGYRLPTESEWEYACRAKTTTPFSFGSVLNGDKANVDGNSPYGTTTVGNHLKRTTTVGTYGANPFGLYDMHGNVWEWCDDVYDEQAYSKRSGVTPDPRVTSGSEYRVWRGGSWGSGSAGTRSARRSRFTPDYRDNNYGFRVVVSAASVKGDVTGTAPAPISPPFAGATSGEGKELVPGMKFRWCPPGTFTMGSPKSEPGRGIDEDQVSVTLSRGFWLSQHETTQGEWQSVMGTTIQQQKAKPNTPGKIPTFDNITGTGTRHPMYFVNHDEATEFCVKLTESERKAGRLPVSWEYRLPTEAQWEYACRAGTKTLFSFGKDAAKLGDYAWYEGNSNNSAQPVGLKKPNDWGLYDMHGNLWEWCSDWRNEKLAGGTNPVGPPSGSFRCSRGGCWEISEAGYFRSADRDWGTPSIRGGGLGFRVAGVPSSE